MKPQLQNSSNEVPCEVQAIESVEHINPFQFRTLGVTLKLDTNLIALLRQNP